MLCFVYVVYAQGYNLFSQMSMFQALGIQASRNPGLNQHQPTQNMPHPPKPILQLPFPHHVPGAV